LAIVSTSKYDVLHRKPPKPAAYEAKPGTCRYCGNPLLDEQGRIRKRASWHKDCLEEFKIIYWPAETRKAVWKRDRGQCANCPTICDGFEIPWEMDHRKPLIEAKGNIEYWKLFNLDLLCLTCHSKKTSAEATARAAARKNKLV
jgi:5-methylcytosine-specific restriction endonuclease McrA